MHNDGADCSCCPPACLQRENKCLKYLSTLLMDLAKLVEVRYLACGQCFVHFVEFESQSKIFYTWVQTGSHQLKQSQNVISMTKLV